MKVEAYIIAWNEADIIRLTINHYKRFCDRIILFDNFSDDGTPEIAKELGCEVRTFGRKGELSDPEYLKVKNYAWKFSEADWVIVVDADEIIYHHDIKNILQRNIDASTIFKPMGWNVFSHAMPVMDYIEVTSGKSDNSYSKLCVFNPKKITDINYVYGCHVAKPTGDVIYSTDEIMLLHYRNIGGPARLVKRHALYRNRLSEINRRFKLGIHYTFSDEQRVNEWHESYKNCSELSAPGTM
jgi:glycosyltransferase involved in cell wall biosynthesis